jgi:hypothetical protein
VVAVSDSQYPGPEAVVRPEYAPPRAMAAVSAFAALAVAAALVPLLSVGLVTVLVGALSVGLGLIRGSQRSITVGAGLQFAGVGLAGVVGLAPIQVVIATGAALVAWDIGTHTVVLGQQLGATNATTRAQLVRGGGSLGAIGTISIAVVVVFVAARGEYPVSALGALMAAAVVLLIVLRATR